MRQILLTVIFKKNFIWYFKYFVYNPLKNNYFVQMLKSIYSGYIHLLLNYGIIFGRF